VAVPAEPDLSPVVPDPAVTAQSQVVTALRSGNLAAAQAVAAAQTATPTLSRALHRLTALWQNRLATITRVITARSAKMRLPHPTTGEPWDVVSVAADRVAISAPNGSASELSWSQVPIRVQARLWTDAASAAGAGPVDHATAMAMNLLADENTTAALQLKRVRPALVPEVAADLDLLMELNLRRTGIALLNRGVEAVRTAHAAQAGQILADLRRTDRSIIAGHEDILARLERLCATQAAPAPTKPESNLPKDLRERQAALRTAGWDPIGNAYLDGLAVVMPAGSGISSPIPAKSRGFGIGVSGTGFLRIIPTRPGGSQSQGINIPLPAEASFFTVNITREGVAVLDAGGKVVDQLRSSSPSLLIIRATGDARMPATPQPLP
jgi:hypothetical protein